MEKKTANILSDDGITAIIGLANGKGQVIIDSEDVEKIKKYRWFVMKPGYIQYAIAHGKDRKTIYMHRVIMGNPKKMQIDHINGNGLDNRKQNLRNVSASLNQHNRLRARKDSTTKLIGAMKWKKEKHRLKPFYSAINLNGKSIYLGSFKTAQEAHKIYIEKKRTLQLLPQKT